MPRMQVRGASSQRLCSLGALAIRLTCCRTTDRLFPPAAAYAPVLMIEEHLRTSSVRRSYPYLYSQACHGMGSASFPCLPPSPAS